MKAYRRGKRRGQMTNGRYLGGGNQNIGVLWLAWRGGKQQLA